MASEYELRQVIEKVHDQLGWKSGYVHLYLDGNKIKAFGTISTTSLLPLLVDYLAKKGAS